MNNNDVRTYAPETKRAAILTFIGVFGSLLLKLFTIIGEGSFVTFTLVSVFVGLIIYFDKSIQSFKLGLTGVEATRVLEAMTAKETEPLPSIPLQAGDVTSSLPLFTVKAYATDEDTQSVIKALGCGPYTFRRIDGVIQETGLSSDSVTKALLWLTCNGLAVAMQNNHGEVWALTQEGRTVFASVLKSV